MCPVHEAGDSAKDIDALYEPKTVINPPSFLTRLTQSRKRGWVYSYTGLGGFYFDN